MALGIGLVFALYRDFMALEYQRALLYNLHEALSLALRFGVGSNIYQANAWTLYIISALTPFLAMYLSNPT